MLYIVVARIINITILKNVRSNGNCELYICEAFRPSPRYGYFL
jgi:amino acid permease